MTQGKIYKPTCSTHKTLSSKTHNLLPLPSHAYSAIPLSSPPPILPTGIWFRYGAFKT